jgi:hypothetical protein
VTLPNFFVIGAGKSGTTSLYYYLGKTNDPQSTLAAKRAKVSVE